jgi:hypothetical protein
MTPPIKRSLVALNSYSKSPDIALRLYQLLKDLRHLCSAENIDWPDLVQRVNAAFTVETNHPIIRLILRNVNKPPEV